MSEATKDTFYGGMPKQMANEWRDLKTMQDVAEAQANGDEIEVQVASGKWWPWGGNAWDSFSNFRARSKPKTRQVKLRAWLINGELRWVADGYLIDVKDIDHPPKMKRAPSEDKVIEVKE